MGTTKLDLYQRAIQHCKQTPISALTDNAEARKRCDLHYDNVLVWLMEQCFWRNAMRTVEITENTGINPEFGYDYAHDIPTDFVRRRAIAVDEFLDYPIDDHSGGSAYRMESGYIHTNVTPIYMQYVSNDTSFGYDLAKWTDGMAEAASLELGARIAPTIAGSDEMADKLRDRARDTASRAGTFDALQQPTERVREGQWTGRRYGRNRRTSWQRA